MDLSFTFTQAEAQIILNAITKEPYGLVVNVINKMQKQAVDQMEPVVPLSE